MLLKLLFFCVIFSVQSQDFKITKIILQDNTKTKSSLLYKLIEVEIGGRLDSITIENGLRKIKRLPSIGHAYYQVHKKEDGYHLVYGVQENFTIIPTFNFYNTNDGELAFQLGVSEYNFLGQNITLSGLYQYDIYNSYGVNFRAPQLFNNRFGLALSHSNLTTLEPVFFESGIANYRYNNTSYEILALYQMNLQHRVEVGINFFNEDYSYVEGAISEDAPIDFNVDKLLFKLIYDYNNLKYHFQYVSGFRSILNFQYVKSTEDVLPDFVIGWNDFLYYKRIGKKGNWGNRLRLGLASNDNSPFAPFAVGNNLNVRGVGNTIDRGTGVVVLNTEYRHTLVDKEWFTFQSNVFLDAGSWRNPGGDFDDFGDSRNFRIYPGIGVRFIHKRIFNAVFRIDYGYGITEQATNGFVFGIGQYF